MNWFDTSGLTSLAKTALKGAQKTIDKALDIQEDSGDEDQEDLSASSDPKKSSRNTTPQKDTDFFSSWGLTVSAESKDDLVREQPVVTESPSKVNAQSAWGSFAGSFFEPLTKEDAIIRPPKAKSMNVISDSEYSSQDDLFSKSQLVMSDTDNLDTKNKNDHAKVEERRGSSRSNVLSFVSSRNSSDSVEVLSQSLKTTPDSEASVPSMSSSSAGQKRNSESVEILPDSLISPSSIECLGFDSYSSDKNSSVSSDPSPVSGKKSTHIGDITEKADTADSVSLVADDDEDTMSYNSISECTAPTVLDTDDKPISPFPKKERKIIEKEFLNKDSSVLHLKMQISENSSNDGSWSDRTLNADSESVSLECTEDHRKEEHDDVLIEKLSDSSSFYNVHVSSDMIRSDNFINVEKQECDTSQSSSSSPKDISMKERISPVSSENKSDLVKIGSDRTSGHTSGDELDTTTSSDIEIIPSPNGESCGFRNSPAKYSFKQGKFDGATSPNLVDLVLGKSLATKIRGHNRELSEASVQSNNSDDSQASENDRLMRRLCEMAEILEARENRLMEVSRNNAELAEFNADLKSQMESLVAKNDGGDINSIAEDYAQRMSALEKKFQQAIREKDRYRKQLDALKAEAASCRGSSEMENILKEKDEVIAQLQDEGEKLSKQQLQHSNIIKKLRVKEKDNEQVIKGLRDKLAEQTAELDRLKRAMAAKEEIEVNQIEAVYRLTASNKKMETELIETRSAFDDTTQRLESTRTSLDAARKELNELQRNSNELQRRRNVQTKLEEEKDILEVESERLRGELQQLRVEMVNEEKRWMSREETLRAELRAAREQALELHAAAPRHHAATHAAADLLAQLAQLQRAALHRDHAHAAALRSAAQHAGELEQSLAKATESERLSREECSALLERVSCAEGLLRDAEGRALALQNSCATLEANLNSKIQELNTLRNVHESKILELNKTLNEKEQLLKEANEALEVEKKRNSILQEQVSCRGDVSPPHSLASDSLSASLWQSEEGRGSPGGAGTGTTAALGVEEALALLTRRAGELRAAQQAALTLRAERTALTAHLAQLQHALDHLQNLQEQYDALLEMYGEKEEQVAELKLDLQDVTALYKQQLDELVALKQALANR